MRLVILLIITLFQFHVVCAQVEFTPLQENYNSIDEWENKENWTVIEGKSNTGWPTGNDIIVIQNTRLKLDSLNIGFNLDEVSTNLTYYLIRQNFTLKIKKDAKANLFFSTQGNQKTEIIVNGELNFKNDIVFNGTGIIFSINGNCIINSDLTFSNSNNLLLVNEDGNLLINGNFTSKNGGKSNFISKGNFTIEGNYTNHGGAELTVESTGTVIIKGNKISKNGGGGLLAIKGKLDVLQSCDLYGSEEINISPSGVFTILGDIILSCSKSISVMKEGNFIFGDESQCIIREEKCYESSINLKICNTINDLDLPIELAKFYGIKENNLNVLYWETYSEYNSNFFEIQSSNNNKQWTIIDSVQAAGISNTLLKYSYIDSLNSGIYYRLRQVDFDGIYQFYGPIALNNNQSKLHVNAYPNVVSEGTRIYLEVSGVETNQEVKAYLMAINGSYVNETTLSVNIEGNYIASYIIPKVPSKGIYILRFIANRSTYEVKVLVQ